MVAAAVVGSAVVGAGASMSAASKASKAANRASEANNALLKAAQDRAYDTIDPYLQPGYDANNALSRIVSGGGYATPPKTGAAANDLDGAAYVDAYTDLQAAWNDPNVQAAWGGDKDAWGDAHFLEQQARNEGRVMPQTAAPTPNAPANPTYGPTIAPRTVGVRPTAAPLDISVGNYQKSPDYDFQLSEGNRNILAQKAALGGLESGSAMKALQKYGQDVALGDYNQWRGYTTQQYNTDRDFNNTNFDIDESRSDARYDADRGYLTSRFDTQVNDLFRLSGQGLNAAGTAINVGQNTAAGMSANNNSAASATGNAAIAGSNQVNSLLGTALQAYGQFKTPQAGQSVSTNSLVRPQSSVNFVNTPASIRL